MSDIVIVRFTCERHGHEQALTEDMVRLMRCEPRCVAKVDGKLCGSALVKRKG